MKLILFYTHIFIVSIVQVMLKEVFKPLQK
jgi:hypothetical protein